MGKEITRKFFKAVYPNDVEVTFVWNPKVDGPWESYVNSDIETWEEPITDKFYYLENMEVDISTREDYKLDIIDFATIPKQESIKYPLHEYDIWVEGYAATGQSSDATYLGKHKGRNFQDACMRYFMKSHLDSYEEDDKNDTYYNTKRWDYDPYRNTYWACGLYETEEEARKSFG